MGWRELFGIPDKPFEASAHHVELGSPWAPEPSPLQTVAWTGLLGDDLLAQLPPTRETALTVASVMRGRTLICGTIARMPLLAYGPDGKTPVADQPEWLTHTGGMLGPFHRMLATVDDLVFYGFSLWKVVRSKIDGRVIAADRVPYEVWSFNSEGTHVVIDNKNVNLNDYILIPGIHSGILTHGAGVIRQYSGLLRSAGRAADNPNAYLELHDEGDTPLLQTEVDELVARWSEARQGKYGGVAYTNKSIKVIEHGAANEHLLVQGRNAAAVDVARLMGIPAALIDAQAQAGSLTYETTQSRNAEFLDYCLAPYLAAISSRLSQDDISPKGTTVGFEIEKVLGSTLPISLKTDDERSQTPVAPDAITPSSAQPVSTPKEAK